MNGVEYIHQSKKRKVSLSECGKIFQTPRDGALHLVEFELVM